VFGTFANCAMGVTPWGTYLTCEENFHGYFGGPKDAASRATAAQRRYGTVSGSQWLDYWRFDERFDLSKHPNEAHRFGWVVEIDPFDPGAVPVKRTALGRKRQESATCTLTRDGRLAVYMGDDAAFEYIYKFVSRDKVRRGNDAAARAANRNVLDEGTLYVARFDADGRGRWLELRHGRDGIDASSGFADQAEVLIHARLAGDIVGATKMDRPEWIAVHPESREVYVTLTHNTQRGAPASPRQMPPTRARTTCSAASFGGARTGRMPRARSLPGTTSRSQAIRSGPAPARATRATAPTCSATPTACASTPEGCCGSRPT
jgi:secreted PhoX family phosphatase